MLQRKVSLLPPPDGGWGWMVMIASCLHAATLFGVLKSGGVLYVAIMKNLDVTRAEAAMIPSLAFSVSCCMSILSTALCARYTVRTVTLVGSFTASTGIILCAVFWDSYIMLVLNYGIFLGLGAGCVMLPIVIIVHQYFDRHRAFASGFAMAGGAIGSIFIPPLFEYLLEKHGMFGAILMLGGIMLHGCPCSMIYRPLTVSQKYSVRAVNIPAADPQEVALFLDTKIEVEEKKPSEQQGPPANGTENDANGQRNGSFKKKIPKDESSIGVESSSHCDRFLSAINLDPTVLRDPYFYLIGYSASCFAFTWISYLNVLPDYAEKEGTVVSPSMAAFLISITSISDIIGRIGFGWISDRQWIERKNFFIILLICGGSVLCLFSLATSYSSFVIGSVFYGLFNGGCLIMPPVLFNQFLGQKRFPAAWAVTTVIGGFIIFGASPTIAAIRDSIGSYKVCMIIMGGSLLSSALFWIMELIFTKCTSTSNPTENHS